MQPKQRIYIDEVGNSDLGSAHDPNHRFLSLTGVILSLNHVREAVHPEMESLKNRYFHSHPDDPVILHRKELIAGHPPFRALRDPRTREAFDADLLAVLKRWEYTVVTVVIDKLEHRNQYQVWRHDPYHYCLMVMLERYVFYLKQLGCCGDALAESRNGKEDRRLKNAFSRLWEQGTDFVSADKFQDVLTSRQLKVKPKQNNISGLQLADLLAHPSRREILLEAGKIEDKRADVFGDKVTKILMEKYYRRGGKIYGRKLLP